MRVCVPVCLCTEGSLTWKVQGLIKCWWRQTGCRNRPAICMLVISGLSMDVSCQLRGAGSLLEIATRLLIVNQQL